MDKDYLPHWAIKRFSGTLEVGTVLCTMNSRSIGNAVIIEVIPTAGGMKAFRVKTEIGSELMFSTTEIKYTFYPPEFITDIDERRKTILNNYSRKNDEVL